MLSRLELVLNLRLGPKSTRQLQDFVGFAQLLDFAHLVSYVDSFELMQWRTPAVHRKVSLQKCI
jgi:hypothetical protein